MFVRKVDPKNIRTQKTNKKQACYVMSYYNCVLQATLMLKYIILREFDPRLVPNPNKNAFPSSTISHHLSKKCEYDCHLTGWSCGLQRICDSYQHVDRGHNGGETALVLQTLRQR